jgi:hypothetical protein
MRQHKPSVLHDMLAQDIFEQVRQRNACPEFKPLVTGQEREIEHPFVSPDCNGYAPMHCYVKGSMIDPSNEEGWSAPNLLPNRRFRGMSSYTEILDCKRICKSEMLLRLKLTLHPMYQGAILENFNRQTGGDAYLVASTIAELLYGTILSECGFMIA